MREARASAEAELEVAKGAWNADKAAARAELAEADADAEDAIAFAQQAVAQAQYAPSTLCSAAPKPTSWQQQLRTSTSPRRARCRRHTGSGRELA